MESVPTMQSRATSPDPWSWQPARGTRIDQAVTLLRLDGPDSLRFLHGQTSQDVQQARPGQWLATCCITPTGRMRALAEVLVDGEGAWLVISGGDGAVLRQALDRVLFPADQVSLGTLRQARWILPMGPTSSAAPGPVAMESATSWSPLEGGEGWWLGETLVLPLEECLPQPLADRQPLEAPQVERWRIQRGLPAAPAELNDGTNPFELGLARRVSLNKGCYVGQETLAKLATYDGVKQQLRRWHCPPQPDAAGAANALAPGTILRDAAGDRAGSITSSLPLQETEGWIGLALVRRQQLQSQLLWVGEGDSRLALDLSVPEDFVPPPCGGGSTPGGNRVERHVEASFEAPLDTQSTSSS